MRTLSELTNLRGRAAIVTGGSGWIGTAITTALLELGANVFVVSRGLSDCFFDETLYVKFGGRLFEIVADLTTDKGIDAVFVDRHVVALKPSILVNNMCSWPSESNIHASTSEMMSFDLTTNVVPHAMMMKRFVDQLAHTPQSGSIINIASMYAHAAPDHEMYHGEGGQAVMYGAAKAAICQMTRHLASLWGQNGVRVNSISPGPISRPGSFDGKPWFEHELKRRTMLGRVGAPDELKGVVALLATDASSYITGVDIPVDGGWTAY